MDSDGDVTEMIPGLRKPGPRRRYPLNVRRVDLSKIGQTSRFLMLGGYDKMVMSKGGRQCGLNLNVCARNENGRVCPLWTIGPQCFLENYRIYIELFKEYARKAVL